MDLISYINKETQLNTSDIRSTITLLNEGATIPFIARYRKQQTGGLDELEISNIKEALGQYQKIVGRQQTIIDAVSEQEKLTNELHEKILACFDLNALEDIYLPYKQKRKTKADKAKALGLEPLAKLIMAQKNPDPIALAGRFLNKEISTTDLALKGAQDIIAEWISEYVLLREKLRFSYKNKSTLSAKVVKSKIEEAENYKDYFDYTSKLNHCPSHRFLAIYRASREGLLRLSININVDEVEYFINKFFVKGQNDCSNLVFEAGMDAFKRLIHPALENEAVNEKKAWADNEAIKVFAENLRQLLLSPPLGNKRILAIDPGFKSGCKVVCLDETGNLLHNETIFPHPPQRDTGKAKSKIAQLVQAYRIEAIAIGNGTAGRETEYLIKNIKFDRDLDVFVVAEDGASIYSASSNGRKEFPNHDVTVRGAVSIGRRLMDPLSELVKIDPKSLGVGQYQHEVDQKKLKEKLDDVVSFCVNEVGVDLNTASPFLLSYVSGLGPQLAENIVEYRKKHNGFNNRAELKNVSRLGEKAFEQCAGFIRIRKGSNPLDNTAVHPESYPAVKKIAKHLKLSLTDLLGNTDIIEGLKASEFGFIDAFTFKQIKQELSKPGRDPRKKIKVLSFDESIKTIADLKEGQSLNGIVTNVTSFGAFVNIGIKENGLIHKSQLSKDYVENPADFIKLHQHVRVKVMAIDVSRKRIGLSMD